MRDPERIDRILEKLREMWHRHPDLRLCQLVEDTVADVSERGHCIFYVEDDRFEDSLDKTIGEE